MYDKLTADVFLGEHARSEGIDDAEMHLMRGNGQIYVAVYRPSEDDGVESVLFTMYLSREQARALHTALGDVL